MYPHPVGKIAVTEMCSTLLVIDPDSRCERKKKSTDFVKLNKLVLFIINYVSTELAIVGTS